MQGSKTRSTRPSTRRVLGTRLVTVAILAYSVPLVGQQKIGRVLGPTRSTRSAEKKKKKRGKRRRFETLITRFVSSLSLQRLSRSSLAPVALSRPVALPHLAGSPSPPSSLAQSASSHKDGLLMVVMMMLFRIFLVKGLERNREWMVA